MSRDGAQKCLMWAHKAPSRPLLESHQTSTAKALERPKAQNKNQEYGQGSYGHNVVRQEYESAHNVACSQFANLRPD